MQVEGRTLLFSGKAEKPQPGSGRGPGRPTREQIEARNRELLDTALDLFLERGFEGTTIEAIIDAVGMARRTIYTRYGDKITLFKAALQRAIDDWVVPAERLHAAESGDLEETLIRIARMMVANVKSPSGIRLARIANAEVFRMPDIGAYLWERTAEVALTYLVELFRRRLYPAASGTLAEDAAGAFLMLVVEGAFQMVTWSRLSDEEFDRQIVYRTRLFLNGARSIGSAPSPSRGGL